MGYIMSNIRKIRNYYLVFGMIYLIVCFVPWFSGGFQTVLQKFFCLVLIVYTVIEFMDNLKEMDYKE